MNVIVGLRLVLSCPLAIPIDPIGKSRGSVQGKFALIQPLSSRGLAASFRPFSWSVQTWPVHPTADSFFQT